jgi:hypothetical protein
MAFRDGEDTAEAFAGACIIGEFMMRVTTFLTPTKKKGR